MSRATVTFPEMTCRTLRDREDLYISHTDLVNTLQAWVAVLEAAGANMDVLAVARTFKQMLSETDT